MISVVNEVCARTRRQINTVYNSPLEPNKTPLPSVSSTLCGNRTTLHQIKKLHVGTAQVYPHAANTFPFSNFAFIVNLWNHGIIFDRLVLGTLSLRKVAPIVYSILKQDNKILCTCASNQLIYFSCDNR